MVHQIFTELNNFFTIYLYMKNKVMSYMSLLQSNLISSLHTLSSS